MDIEVGDRTFRVKPGYEGLVEQCLDYQWFRDQLEYEADLTLRVINARISAPRGPIRIPMSPTLAALGDDLGL